MMGCWGARRGSFVFCSGCESEILDLTAKSGRNMAIADFLESRYRLFDHPLHNNVHTALFSIQENFSSKGKPVFSKDLFAMMERFCIMHSRCGLFLRLKLSKEEGDGEAQKTQDDGLSGGSD